MPGQVGYHFIIELLEVRLKDAGCNTSELTSTYVCARIYICMYVCMYVRVHVCVYARECVCVYEGADCICMCAGLVNERENAAANH